jgi:hypothetical protein
MPLLSIDPRSFVITPLLLFACAADDSDGPSVADASTGDVETPSTGSTSEPSTDTNDDANDESTGDDPCSTPDADGDGHAALACGGDDCDDGDALVHPGVEHDGWEPLVRHLHSHGGGCQYHTAITGHDGFVDVFWAFNGSLWHMAQQDELVWGGPVHLGNGNEPRVALGPDGAHHMVYVGFAPDLQTRGAFYMQVGSTAIRTLEELPLESPNPFGLDIEVDPATGTMHVVYGVLHEFPPTLRYATSDDGEAWTVETIAVEAAGFGGTLVLDDGGAPHVSFASNENEVMHGVRVDGSWTVEVAASGYEVAATSMARDSDGDLHIAFSVTGLEDFEDGLHYVRSAGGQWGEASEVDADVVWYDEIGAWDYRPAIAVGDGGEAHLAYHDWGAGVLRYAVLLDGYWQRRVIDEPPPDSFYPQMGWYPQIELEGGELHINAGAEATNEYRRYTFVPDDARDNDCDGAVDEGP